MNIRIKGEEYQNGIELLLGLCISFFLLLCFYPEFLLFQSTPMYAKGWELSDPSVSWANFTPSFRVFQYELYQNFNLLWSSLRTMGMPLLANDIQAAPLFPLTLVLSWLDEHSFWNVYVVSRLVLLGLGTYLLGRKFFSFQRLPAILFVITFVYAMYVLRWMNNPWQNGLLSGVWYLFFLLAVLEVPRGYTFGRFGVFCGLTLAVFMMVTCGFPEASVMSTIMVVLIYIPCFVAKTSRGEIRWRPYLQDLILAHLVGFSLSAPQIFAIVELLQASESHRFVGYRQYEAAKLLPFFLENLTRFTEDGPKLFSDSRTYLGLLPLSLFIVGLLTTFGPLRKRTVGEIGALLCGLFIIFKMFAIGPAWFNTIVAKPPILRESYFYVYFFSIFLWFFSFFAARGFQEVINYHNDGTSLTKKIWRIAFLLLPVVILLLTAYGAEVVTQKKITTLIFTEQNRVLITVILLFLVNILLLNCYLWRNGGKIWRYLVPVVVLLSIIVESNIVLPKQFFSWREKDTQQLVQLLAAVEEQGIRLEDSRIIDRNGTYVSDGLATIDTGATPLLPLRTQTFRTNFFKTVRAGHLSIERPKAPFSWGISSTNLLALDRYYGSTTRFYPNWDELKKKEGGNIAFDTIKVAKRKLDRNTIPRLELSPQDFFYVSGWAIGEKGESLISTETFVVFQMSGGDEIVAPVRRVSRSDVARHLGDEGYLMAGWDGYISGSVFPQESFAVLVRFVDRKKNVYYEQDTNVRFIVERAAEDIPRGLKNKAAIEQQNFLGVLDHYYIYHDEMALSRAYLAASCDYYASTREVVETFKTTKTFTLGDVYLEELDGDEQEFCVGYNRRYERVQIRQDRGKSVDLAVVEGPAVLVLNDNVYPGWHAYDNISNIELDIRPANITFRSVVLPEKRKYQVSFYYRPVWWTPALAMMFLGTVVFLAMGVFCLRNSTLKNM